MSQEAAQILDNQTAIQPVAPATPQAPQAKPEEEAISSKLAVLMERERQALNRERMAKSQEEKLKERLQKIEEFEAVKSNPTKALEMLGLSYDQLTQTILKDGEVPPSVEIQRLRDELGQFKSQQQERFDKEAEEKKKQNLQAESKAVTDFKSEIAEHLKSNPERYEYITFEGADELVYELIDEDYLRTIDPATGVGKVMPIAEAADKVEKHLEEKDLKRKDLKKSQAFWNQMPKNIQNQLTAHIQKQEPRQSPKTLTNNMGPKVIEKPTRPPEDTRVKQILADFLAKRQSQTA